MNVLFHNLQGVMIQFSIVMDIFYTCQLLFRFHVEEVTYSLQSDDIYLNHVCLSNLGVLTT